MKKLDIRLQLFDAIRLAALAVFLFGIWMASTRYASGRPSTEHTRVSEAFRNVLLGLGYAAKVLLTHSTIRRRDAYAGVAHAAIFVGFVVLVVSHAIPMAFRIEWFSWWYKLCLDLFGLAFILGMVMMMLRRAFFRLPKLDYTLPRGVREGFDRRIYRWGDWLFLSLLLAMGLLGFLMEGLLIAAGGSLQFRPSTPVGWAFALLLLRGVGIGPEEAVTLLPSVLLLHVIITSSFLASIPYTKAIHLLASLVSIVVTDERAGRRLEPVLADVPVEEIGYTKITDFSRKHLLNLDACTKCGKCHEACPARATGLPLSPRDLILELREHAGTTLGLARILRGGNPTQPLVANIIQADTLWACMQCRACMEACPVSIEHVPIINQMRRSLIQRGEMPPMLQATLETIHQTGNSLGESNRKRGRWTAELEFQVKDARKEPVEYLWFVGDYASFDPRSQRVSRILARILRQAGVDFGLLYDSEKNSGNDVRRVGEEDLYAWLARSNIESIQKYQIKRIFTTDPHSLHTIKNEYPDLGGRFDIQHHTTLLMNLIGAGRLSLTKRLDYRVTYHDPCHLGRLNREYELPRRLLRSLGVELVEMPRNRSNSFCCGAGGGRIWIPATPGQEKPSENRIREAIALGDINYFVVACPKDVTMYEDAIKTSGHQGDIELKEITELVGEAVGISP